MTILKILDLIGLLISTVNWAQTSQTSITLALTNAQSVRNKTDMIVDHIIAHAIDVLFSSMIIILEIVKFRSIHLAPYVPYGNYLQETTIQKTQNLVWRIT